MTQICRGFTTAQWRRLSETLGAVTGQGQEEVGWRLAIDVFERRMRERFLSCIEALELADSKSDVEPTAESQGADAELPADNDGPVVVPGFSIMALCCLLIETLQSFRVVTETPTEGLGTRSVPNVPDGRSALSTSDLFAAFLQLPAFRGEFEHPIARRFVSGLRNGVLHEAETRRWVIWREEPRCRLVEEVSTSPWRYAVNRTAFYAAIKVEFLRYVDDLRNPQNHGLRKRFVEKMDRIAVDS